MSDMGPSELLRRWRLRCGHSQAEVARLLGCARQTVNKWEQGAEVPSLGSAVALEGLTGIPASSWVIIADSAERGHSLLLRSGYSAAVEICETDGLPIYFCGRGKCPHYHGQQGLLPGADEMFCALAGYAPERICQPYYLELAEELDRARRRTTTWEQRLDDAEAFEAAVARAVRSAGAAA